MKKILSIIAPENYQDIEYVNSKAALEAAGHTVITASAVSEAHGALGGSVKTDLLLKDANEKDFSAVVFIGGGGCFEYFDDSSVHQLARDFFDAGKIVAAICAAPSILANAGLLEGVTCTCFPSQADHIKDMGANYTGRSVEQDGLIITADGPSSATAFGDKIAQAL